MRKGLLPLLMICACLPVSAQEKDRKAEATPEAERPASEARSFMELFAKLERDWILAVQHKDKAALDKILAPEFIVRTSTDPERPVLRADWMQEALGKWEIRSYSHHAMAIRAFAAEAVVSFLQTQQATIDGKDRSGDYFVVDLWVVNHGNWQVAARYLAPVDRRSASYDNLK
jgi:Domain of unknown function (DUF4440)